MAKIRFDGWSSKWDEVNKKNHNKTHFYKRN